jgi:hypothetical protein
MANAEGKVAPSTNTCKGEEDTTVPRCHGSEAWLRTRTRSPVTNGVLSTMLNSTGDVEPSKTT